MNAPSPAAEYPQLLRQQLLSAYCLTGHATEYFYDNKGTVRHAVGDLAYRSLSLLTAGLDTLGLFPPAHVWRKLEAYAQYECELQASEPPTDRPTPVKTLKRTHNHVNDYALNASGLGYFRPKEGSEGTWYPFYIPVKASEIYCDGANLAVVAARENDAPPLQRIFTKKVLKEWRRPSTGEYCFTNLTQRDNWRESWFHLPVIHLARSLPLLKLAFFLLGDAHLTKPEHGTIAFSHRGVKNRFYVDPKGKKHIDHYGVSQMICLQGNPPKLLYADPWLPFGFSYQYALPDSFAPLGGDVSASSVVLIGKYREENGDKTTKLFLRSVDYDILGNNPFYKAMGWYTRDSDNQDPHKMFLPPLEWEEVPLPVEGSYEALSKRIGISQIGEGNDARLLTIPCLAENSEYGFFSKKPRDKDWAFVSAPGEKIPEDDLIVCGESTN